MRPPQKNRGNRNKGGRGGGGHKPMGNVQNRVFESAGPEGKVRGTPQQIIDKYLILARDSQTSGDRVGAENFLQHAEHYIRLLNTAQSQFEERRQQPFPGRGEFDDATDGDDDDGASNEARRENAEAVEAGEFDAQPDGDQRRAEPQGQQGAQRRADGNGQNDGEQRRGDGQRRRDDRAPRRSEAPEESRDPVAAEAPAGGGLETIDPSDESEGGLVATPESRAEDEPPAKKRAPRRRRRPAAEGEEAAQSDASSSAQPDAAPEAQVG